jgi:hypothetical protein
MSKPKTMMPPRWALISLGIILFLIAVVSGIYFTSGHLFIPSSTLAIQDVSVSRITETGAAITWTTDKPATSQTSYGYTADCRLATAFDEELVTSHRVEITGLQPNATCYFRVISQDAGGKEVTSDTGQLTTLPRDTTPPVISKVKVAGYTGETATITWETDEDVTGQVEYGETDAYGKLAATDGELTTSHSVGLTWLQPNTTYHFRVKSTDESGNKTGSGDQAFTNWVAEKDWAEYVNEEYGFSIQYPSHWVARPDLATRSTYRYLAAFSVEAWVPGLCVAAFDDDEPVSEDWAIEAYKKMDNQGIKVVSPLTETTLSDGTKATTYKIEHVALHQPNSTEDYETTSYCLDADKGSKRIHVWVFTIEYFDSFNEALFSQIAHTLRFSAE